MASKNKNQNLEQTINSIYESAQNLASYPEYVVAVEAKEIISSTETLKKASRGLINILLLCFTLIGALLIVVTYFATTEREVEQVFTPKKEYRDDSLQRKLLNYQQKGDTLVLHYLIDESGQPISYSDLSRTNNALSDKIEKLKDSLADLKTLQSMAAQQFGLKYQVTQNGKIRKYKILFRENRNDNSAKTLIMSQDSVSDNRLILPQPDTGHLK